MPVAALKNYVIDPRCVVCGRQVRPWGHAQCDNCGRTCCRSHRPYFQAFWQCPECAQRQHQYTPAPPPSVSTAADAAHFFVRMAAMEQDWAEMRMAPSKT